MSTEKLFSEFGRELRRAHERADILPHYGERALERENALTNLLNHRIPTRFRAARGFILYEDGLDDQQIDCLVYDAFNYGTRSNLLDNVVAPSKSVAIIIFETLNLTKEKFLADVKRIEEIKVRIEADKSFDLFSGTAISQPLGFIVAYRALNNGKPWDILQAYQDEFERLAEGDDRWRHLVDGVLIMEPGDFLTPVAQFRDGSLKYVTLNNVKLPLIPQDTIIGLANTPASEDCGDLFFEILRRYLMGFKNPGVQDISGKLQINQPCDEKQVNFARCFRI